MPKNIGIAIALDWIWYPYLPWWQERGFLAAFVLTGALLFLGAIFALILRMKSRLESQNRELHERLKTLAMAEERLRIAQEMHDGLAQVLAYVNTKAQVVKELLRTGRTDDASRHLDELASAAREVYDDARESIIGLRDAALPGRSLGDALQEYARSWEAQHGIVCRLKIDRGIRLPDNAELQLQRIVQESLTNVRKHAQARHVDVTLQRTDSAVVATVEDDGLGFNPEVLGPADLPRFGLATMRERAESIGAKVRLNSSPGQGTRLTLEIPAPTSPS